MRLVACSLAMLSLANFSPIAAHAQSVTLQDIDAAISAREASQWSEFLTRIQAISAQHPSQPTFRYLLAQAHARNGDGQSAIAELRWLGEQGYAYGASTHAAFEGLRQTAAFMEVAGKLEANATIEIGRVNAVLTFDRSDIRPEGVTLDVRRARFLVSSVSDGAVYAVSRRGVTSALWREARTNREGTGVRVTPGLRRRAVFCSNSSPDVGTGSELIELDLRSGRQTASISLPRIGAGKSYCNDIALIDGGFAVTDSERGMVWLIDRSLRRITPMLDEGLLLYPNGVAASSDGNLVYVADMLGISMISVETGNVRRVEAVDDLSLAGIDGLYIQNDRLVAIQNAISPERIIEIGLGPRAPFRESDRPGSYRTLGYDDRRGGQRQGVRTLRNRHQPSVR